LERIVVSDSTSLDPRPPASAYGWIVDDGGELTVTLRLRAYIKTTPPRTKMFKTVKHTSVAILGALYPETRPFLGNFELDFITARYSDVFEGILTRCTTSACGRKGRRV
jgi:hypothetical protein